MTEAIAILALCVSVLMLAIQYINQLERRHGEITQLRSNLIAKLSLIQQRVTSFRMHAETARIELRKMTNSDDKYDSIEKTPTLIANTKKLEEKIKNLINRIEAVDTAKKNTSKALLIFQASQHDVKTIDDASSTFEKEILDILEMIHSRQSSRGRKAKE